jgi:hypothetical protein
MTAGRVDQIQEIESVKRQMAKGAIPCSVSTITQALLLPEELEDDKTLSFPKLGTGLMVNPYSTVGKKKKKKKGKKGKKRGKKRR